MSVKNNLIRCLLSPCAFAFLVVIKAASSFGADIIQEEVAKILDGAIERKELFELGTRKRKYSNFYAFYYDIPASIRKEDLANFIECMKKTIKEHDLVGPNRRPLTLNPLKRTKRKRSNSSDKQIFRGYSNPGNHDNRFVF